MSSLNYLIKHKKIQKECWSPSVKLRKCPFKQALVFLVFVGSPKKPHSGKRKLAKVIFGSQKKAIVTIPDGNQMGGVTLQKYNKVLIRGGRACDVPGAHYKILKTSKGRINDTMASSVNRKQRRSKFGTARPTQ